MRSMREAARALGIDHKTLVVWLGQAGITPDQLERDTLDSRIRYIPDDVLAGIAGEHGRNLTMPSGGPDLSPVLRRLDTLERRIHALEARDAIASSGSLIADPQGDYEDTTDGETVPLRPFAARHGISESSARSQELTGRIHTTRRPVPNRKETSHTLTVEQQRYALSVWKRSASYHPCDVASCLCHDFDAV